MNEVLGLAIFALVVGCVVAWFTKDSRSVEGQVTAGLSTIVAVLAGIAIPIILLVLLIREVWRS